MAAVAAVAARTQPEGKVCVTSCCKGDRNVDKGSASPQVAQIRLCLHRELEA